MAPIAASFCAIDFETACADRSSVCCVGVVRVRDGEIVQRYRSLVMPPTGLDSFNPYNVRVHGITSGDVRNAPVWNSVFGEVMAVVGHDDLVAHNAPFDRSVMHAACSAVDIDWPTNVWRDTLAASRRLLTLGSYSLPFVSAALGIDDFAHHDAVADAEQAALVALSLAQRVGAGGLDAVWAPTAPSGRSPAGARRKGDFSGLTAESPLAGEFVAFTGALVNNSRSEAIALVGQLGGIGQQNVTKSTTILVTGDFDARTFRPGAELSTKLRRALQLAEAGQPIEILTEPDFLLRVELSRDDLVRATREQRALTRGSTWLPQYVLDQALSLDPTLPYNTWIRRALQNPGGRAQTGEPCVRCGAPVDRNTFWLFAERHVCGGDCAESLKRTAKREWERVGARAPEPR